jgi:hypothetical protein
MFNVKLYTVFNLLFFILNLQQIGVNLEKLLFLKIFQLRMLERDIYYC